MSIQIKTFMSLGHSDPRQFNSVVKIFEEAKTGIFNALLPLPPGSTETDMKKKWGCGHDIYPMGSAHYASVSSFRVHKEENINFLFRYKQQDMMFMYACFLTGAAPPVLIFDALHQRGFSTHCECYDPDELFNPCACDFQWRYLDGESAFRYHPIREELRQHPLPEEDRPQLSPRSQATSHGAPHVAPAP